MLGSESIEEMFNRPDWSEEEGEDDGERVTSESLLQDMNKNSAYLPNDTPQKDTEGTLDKKKRKKKHIYVLVNAYSPV